MSPTYAQNVVRIQHKERRNAIPEELQPRLWAYVAGICKHAGILVHAVGGTEDHLHLLVQIPPSLAVAKAVLMVKSNSSRWAKEVGHQFAWQEGYGAFSVSHSLLAAAIRYVQNQKAHHRKMGFAAELDAWGLVWQGCASCPTLVFRGWVLGSLVPSSTLSQFRVHEARDKDTLFFAIADAVLLHNPELFLRRSFHQRWQDPLQQAD